MCPCCSSLLHSGDGALLLAAGQVLLAEHNLSTSWIYCMYSSHVHCLMLTELQSRGLNVFFKPVTSCVRRMLKLIGYYRQRCTDVVQRCSWHIILHVLGCSPSSERVRPVDVTRSAAWRNSTPMSTLSVSSNRTRWVGITWRERVGWVQPATTLPSSIHSSGIVVYSMQL